MPPSLSVITDEISQDFDHALAVAHEIGAESVELRSLWGMNIADLSDDDVARAVRLVKGYGLVVNCIASPFLKVSLHPQRVEQRPISFFMEERSHEEHFAMLRRCLELARRFECPVARAFSFWRDPSPTQDDWASVVGYLKRATELAEQAGCTLALENEHTCTVATGAETRRMVDEVGTSHLKVIWDPANAFCAGEMPYPDGYRQVCDYIVDVHVKDASRGQESRECVYRVLGEGSIDWRGQIQALIVDGYAGHITMETHPIVGLSGEQATRRNFAVLLDMLAASGAYL